MHTGGASNDTSLLVYRFQELPNNQRHTLDPLDLFLRAQQLPPQIMRLVEDVFLESNVSMV